MHKGGSLEWRDFGSVHQFIIIVYYNDYMEMNPPAASIEVSKRKLTTGRRAILPYIESLFLS